jgi:hypothetical protein
MSPLKASLFFVFALLGITVFGISLSHVWNIKKEIRAEKASIKEMTPLEIVPAPAEFPNNP